MAMEKFTIDTSSLEKAQNTKDSDWLKDVQQKAVRTIKAGGAVAVEQQFSDASSEIIAIIDNEEMLERFMEKYFR